MSVAATRIEGIDDADIAASKADEVAGDPG